MQGGEHPFKGGGQGHQEHHSQEPSAARDRNCWFDLGTPPSKVREALAIREPVVPEVDAWRIKYLGSLLEQRDRLINKGEEESEDVGRIQDLINSLCTN